mgnify:CR=1 FL=1
MAIFVSYAYFKFLFDFVMNGSILIKFAEKGYMNVASNYLKHTRLILVKTITFIWNLLMTSHEDGASFTLKIPFNGFISYARDALCDK